MPSQKKSPEVTTNITQLHLHRHKTQVFEAEINPVTIPQLEKHMETIETMNINRKSNMDGKTQEFDKAAPKIDVRTKTMQDEALDSGIERKRETGKRKDSLCTSSHKKKKTRIEEEINNTAELTTGSYEDFDLRSHSKIKKQNFQTTCNGVGNSNKDIPVQSLSPFKIPRPITNSDKRLLVAKVSLQRQANNSAFLPKKSAVELEQQTSNHDCIKQNKKRRKEKQLLPDNEDHGKSNEDHKKSVLRPEQEKGHNGTIDESSELTESNKKKNKKREREKHLSSDNEDRGKGVLRPEQEKGHNGTTDESSELTESNKKKNKKREREKHPSSDNEDHGKSVLRPEQEKGHNGTTDESSELTE